MTMDALPFPYSKMGIHLTSLIQNSTQKTHSTHPIMIPGQRRRPKAIYSNSLNGRARTFVHERQNITKEIIFFLKKI
jgi:hypothetical protein